ncbi:MAG: tetratricopeptide repeat protein [Candidatus Izemoplasmatales bacterium]
MTIYDFSCAFYFKENFDKLVMIEYLKKKDQVTQKEINESAKIATSNYRRAQLKGFIGYEEMVDKMANYLNIQTKIDPSTIEELDQNFSRFYTSVCFSQSDEVKKHFDSINEKKALYENSILMIEFYLAQLIFYITDINYSRQMHREKQNEAIAFLSNFVDKMSSEHRFLYYDFMCTKSAIEKDRENVVHYARLTSYLAVNYPELEPTANYHISFSYSLISDFINALIYANKALPKLEEQLNYVRAVFCRVNIAALYKKLGNIDEAKRLLRKNLVYISYSKLDKLLRATELNYADCLLMEENYSEALEHYNIILDGVLKKPDYESIMKTYCLYKLNRIDEANNYTVELELLHKDKKYNYEYLSLIQFFRSYFNKEDNLDKAYRTAEEQMPGYALRGSYIQELAKSLFEGTNNKKQTKLPSDSQPADYIL